MKKYWWVIAIVVAILVYFVVVKKKNPLSMVLGGPDKYDGFGKRKKAAKQAVEIQNASIEELKNIVNDLRIQSSENTADIRALKEGGTD